MSVLKNIFLLNLFVIACGNKYIEPKYIKEQVRLHLDEITKRVLAYHEREMWHAYEFNSGIVNREELILKSIKSENEFNIGQQVTEWQTINVRNKSYAVGLMPTGFTVFTAHLNKKKSGFTTNFRIIDLKDEPTAFTLLKSWNSVEKKYDIIVIVGLAGKNFNMHWYKITDDNNLVEIWWWHLHKKVHHLKVFDWEEQFRLLVVNEEVTDSHIVTADIYNFILDRNVSNFWLLQTLPLDCPATSSATNNFGQFFFLSLPQKKNDSVKIFHFFENRFILYDSITSKNVDTVASFSIGYQSYIAIGGGNFAIYIFSKVGLQQEDVIDANLGEVTQLLVVPIETYRDEIVLLVQHELDHGTHKSMSVEMIFYSKGRFIAHEEVPCTAYGQFSHGASCIADEELPSGIYGAAPLSFNEVLGIVVPRFEVYSGLFMIDWQLVAMKDPMVEEADQMMETVVHIQKMLTEEKHVIAEIESSLSHTVDPNKDNIITGFWDIHTLVAPKVTIENIKQSSRMAEDKRPTILDEIEEEIELLSSQVNDIQSKLQTHQKIRTAEVHEYDDLTIHGQLIIQGNAHIDRIEVEKINDDVFNEFVDDCVRRGNNTKVSGKKKFAHLTARNMTFVTMNDISADDFVHKIDGKIVLHGDLFFEKPLHVKNDIIIFPNGTVNGMKLDEELVYTNANITYPRIQFEHVEIEQMDNVYTLNNADMTVFLEGHENFVLASREDTGIKLKLENLYLPEANISAEYVNGEEFTSFLRSLYLRNSNYSFPGTTVMHGSIHVLGHAEIETLNNLKFPDDYLVNNRSGFAKITGKKVFMGNVSATEVLVNGLVNGIDPNQVITLSVNQTIPGNVTISSLEVAESLEVGGNILGPNLDVFVPNPTLEETNVISASVIFDKLEVDGNIIISDNLDKTNFRSMLEEIVYTDEEKAVITAPKIFSGYFNASNMYISSNILGGVNIDDILTDDTDQTLYATNISGLISIRNLEVDGLYDGVQMTKLFGEMLRLDGDYEIPGRVIFESYDDIPSIVASELQMEKINGLDESALVFTTGDRVFTEELTFDKIKAEQVTFEKDFNYGIEGFDIEYYDQYRFSLSRDQVISGNYLFKNCTVENLEVQSLNDFDADDIKVLGNINNILEERLLNGKLQIEELHVNGSVEIETLNNYNMKEVLNTVIWTNRPNNFTGELVFKNLVRFKKLNIKNINDYSFDWLLKDIVFKNQTDVHFAGQKTFTNGLEIKSRLYTDYINDDKVEDFLTDIGDQTIEGNVIIHGDVWVESHLDIKDDINGVPISLLQTTVKYENGKYFINGDITFDENVTIENMYVKGLVNNEPLEHYLEDIVSVHDDAVINGTLIFEDEVTVEKNMGVGYTINDIDLDKFMKTVVLISSDSFIKGLIVFTQDVYVTENIEIETNLDTRYLQGIDLEVWKTQTIRIDSYMPGQWTFENVTVLGNMWVNYINDKDMSKIIPLHTEQYIDEDVQFNHCTVSNDIIAGNLVNGRNLEEEFQDSYLRDIDEIIDVEVVFEGPVTITGNLKTSGLVNGKDLQRVVTTDTDQNLTASYIFMDTVTIDSDMYVSGKVNDINITEWVESVVTADGNGVQDIRDPWQVQGNITFESDVGGTALIGGYDLNEMVANTERRLQEKYAIQEQLKKNYTSSCYKVKDFLEAAKSQIFIFKRFENYQELPFVEEVESVHTFEFDNKNYLLVNLRANCFSKIYLWTDNYYKFLTEVETGSIEQIITVLDDNGVYLVMKTYNLNTCLYVGINMWVLSNDVLIHTSELEDAVELHHSELQNIFYTLNIDSVTEYKLSYEHGEMSVHPYRKWEIPAGNYTFNPHGQPHGFSLRSKSEIVKLSRKKSKSAITDEDLDIISGDIVTLPNNEMKFVNEGEVLKVVVGIEESLYNLTAVATHQETTIVSKTDTIQFYEDLRKGIVFTKIFTFKPSNMVSLNFGGNGETIFAFLENNNYIEVYEYKGIEGFRHRSSIRMRASKMSSVDLPLQPYYTKRSFLLVTYQNKVSVIHAVMAGDRPIGELYCDT